MHEEWTLLKRLIWLWRVVKGGASSVLRTVTGSIIHITDALAKPAHELVAVLKPVQDMHGYDAPWPAGGGKNKFDYDTAYAQFKVGDNSFIGSSLNFASITNYIPDSLVGQTLTFSAYIDLTGLELPTAYLVQANVSGSNINGNAIVHGNTGYTEVTFTPTSTSDSVKFTCGSGESTIKIKDIQLEIGSSRTAWTPYSNECPISGWNGAEVWNDPKYGGNIWWNQIASQDYDNYRKINCGISTSGNVKTISLDSGRTDCIYTFKKSNVILPVNHISLFVVNNLDLSHINGRVRASYVNAVNNSTDYPLTNNNYRIHSMPTDVYGFGFYASELSEGDYYTFTSINVFDLTAMFGSAVAAQIYAMEQAHAGDGIAWFKNLFPKDYYAYNSGTETVVSAVNGDPYKHIPITFPAAAGTVYGGTLTLNEDGSCDVVAKMAEKDLGSLSYYYSSTYLVFRTSSELTPTPKANAHCLCEMFVETTNSAPTAPDNSVSVGVSYYGSNRAAVKTSLYDNVNDFTAAMSGVKLVYEVENPQTYHFDNIGQLLLFAGENNIWVDASDDLTLTYYADGNVSDKEALNTLLGGMYSPGGDVSDREALDILLGN